MMMRISRSYKFHDEFYALNLLSIPIDNISHRSYGNKCGLLWSNWLFFKVFKKIAYVMI